MKCSSCGFKNPEDSTQCEQCGRALSPHEPTQTINPKDLQLIEFKPGDSFGKRYQIIEKLADRKYDEMHHWEEEDIKELLKCHNGFEHMSTDELAYEYKELFEEDVFVKGFGKNEGKLYCSCETGAK